MVDHTLESKCVGVHCITTALDSQPSANQRPNVSTARRYQESCMIRVVSGSQDLTEDILLAILADQAVIIHGHSVKGIERVVRCCNENANVEETKRDLVSTRISYVLCTSFSFWVCCTFATKKGIFLQGL